MTQPNYRAYFFGNMYLSSIQQGIQAGHVVAELFTKYPAAVVTRASMIEDRAGRHLWSWADNDKTMILLNAGYGAEIWSLKRFFDLTNGNPYPWTYFNEEDDALDGAITSIGIVLPNRIYETASVIRSNPTIKAEYLNDGIYKTTGPKEARALPTDLNDWEIAMIQRLPQYGLAR